MFIVFNVNFLEVEGFGRFVFLVEEIDVCWFDNEEEEGELFFEESDEFVILVELCRNRVSSKGYILYILWMLGLMLDNYMYRIKYYWYLLLLDWWF